MTYIYKALKLVLPILALVASSPAGSSAKAVDDFVADQLVCRTVAPQVIDTINGLYGTTLTQFLPLGNSYLLQTQAGADVKALAAEIALNHDVVYCEPNFLLDAPEPVQSSQPFLDQQQVGTYPDQEAAQTLELSSAHSTSTGQSVTVGVVDAGMTVSHPAFDGSAVSGFDYVALNTTVTDPGGSAAGHGTFVAGVVNLMAPESEIRAYRVLDTAGTGNGFTVAEAVLQAVADGCKVVNLSIVMNGKHSTLDDAIEYARDNGVLVVAAAGNDSAEVERFPAEDSYTLAVAGLDSTNVKADFSNWNGKVDISAPSTQIYAPFMDTSYAWWDGTSFATPFVAGLAALLWEVHPEASVDQVRNAITMTAINVDSINPTYENGLGAGLIDPPAAIAYIQSLSVPCGDANGSGGSPDISDLTYLVDFLFRAGPAPVSMERADLNGSGSVNVSDLSYLVDFLFRGGPLPTCGF